MSYATYTIKIKNYTIKIKKEYASAIIEELKQVDAIEILEESVLEWQKEESLKRPSEMKANII